MRVRACVCAHARLCLRTGDQVDVALGIFVDTLGLCHLGPLALSFLHLFTAAILQVSVFCLTFGNMALVCSRPCLL